MNAATPGRLPTGAARVGRLYLVSDKRELDRRRALLPPGAPLEIWQDLFASDVPWLGDAAARRIAYGRTRADAPRGLYWMGQTAKSVLDAVAAPLPCVLAVPETAVPIYYGLRLANSESLPSEESLRARILSAHGIGVVWATYDDTGARREPVPGEPTDPTFFLRRPGGGAIHLWQLFRTRAAAAAHAALHMAGDAEARAWADAIPAPDFDALIVRFGEGG